MRLGAQTGIALEQARSEVRSSAGAIWEIGIKVGVAKRSLSLPFGQWMSQAIADLRMTLLPIAVRHGDAQVGLPGTMLNYLTGYSATRGSGTSGTCTRRSCVRPLRPAGE